MKRLTLPVALFREWNKLVRKFYNLYEQVVKLRSENSPLWHLRMLTERLKKTYKRLSRLQLKVGVKLAGTAIALMLATSTLNAQDYTFEGRLMLYTPQSILLTRTAPAFGDFDNDGDLDLFIGEQDGTIDLFFNRDGKWVNGGKVSSGYNQTLDVGDWAMPAVGDIDGDGKIELVVGNKQGNIKIFKRWDGIRYRDFYSLSDLYVDTIQVDVGDNAAPALVDIDNDGDLDIVVGNYNGYLYLYVNNGTGSFSSGGKLKYENNNDIHVNYYSAPVFADLDNDGDQDLIIGDYYGSIVELFNNGSGQFSQPQTIATGVGYAVAPALADIDGDGDLDLYIGSTFGNIALYVNDSGSFTYYENLRQAGSYARNLFGSTITLADVDNDGDLDLYAGLETGKIAVMKNINGYFGAVDFLKDASGNDINVIGYAAPAFADLDGDGDLDLYVGYYQYDYAAYAALGKILVYENTDTGFVQQGDLTVFDTANNQSHELVVSYYAAPTFADIDNDGDLDLLVGTNYGKIRKLMNDGTNQFLDYGYLKVDGQVFSIQSYLSKPATVDLDEDGDLDLVVGGNYNLYLLTNQGDGTFSGIDTLSYGSDIPSRVELSPAFGNIYTSCHPDLIVSDYFSYFAVYKYRDTTPPVISCVSDTSIILHNDNVYVVQGTEFDPVSLWDNCEIDTVYNSYNFDTTLAGATFSLGDTTITWYVVDKAGLVDSCSFTVTITAPAGLDNPEFAVYPNPASDYTVITGATGWRVELLDLQGRTVIAPVEVNSGNFKLDLKHLQPGVYVLRLSNERAVETRRLIVR